MKQTLALAVLAAVIIGMAFGALSLDARAKVRVCHKEGNGGTHIIEISDNALKAHMAHGDTGAAGWQRPGDECQLPVVVSPVLK
jgi:hypothetical protein